MNSDQQPRPFRPQPNHPANEPALAVETERLRQLLRQQQPEALVKHIGGTYTAQEEGKGRLALELWGSPVILDFPELVAHNESQVSLSLPGQALIIYYLITSDGSPLAGEWVSFADLTGGRTYAQAFQGYSGNEVVRAFGQDIGAFERACQAAGGTPFNLGDAAYTFPALPRVPLLVTYWLGDEDFPSSCKVLFDRSATHHLPIDVCAILGSMLVSRIRKAHQNFA